MNEDMKRHDAMTLAAGLVIDCTETDTMTATAKVLASSDLDEARLLVISLVRLASAMFEAEADAWADGDYGDPGDEELPPAATVLGLFRRANRQ